MTIGFDGIRTVDGDSPLSYYDRILIASLGLEYKRNTFMVYSPWATEDRGMSWLLSISNIHNKTPYKAINKWLWRNRSGIYRDFRRHGVKVFHGLDAVLPTGNGGCRMVNTLRDLSFKRMMSDYSWFERITRKGRIRKACHKATRVIATSNYIKQQAVEKYGISESKVDVIYTAYRDEYVTTLCDEAFMVNVKSKYHLPRRFVLAVTDFSSLANMDTLYRAFAKIDDKDIYLVIIGHKNDYYRRLKRLASELGIEDRVVRVRSVNKHNFMAFYGMCKAFVEPALEDGMGQCVIEAMVMGAPVIASDDGCHREIAGDHALYFKPTDVDELTRHLNNVLDEGKQEQVASRTAAAREHALQFSQQALAQATMRTYNRVLGRE